VKSERKGLLILNPIPGSGLTQNASIPAGAAPKSDQGLAAGFAKAESVWI
jgi:hypothetical protein